MGAERLAEALPPIIRAVRDSGHPVVWVTDPMHGNMFRTSAGVKTRSFETIMAEIVSFFSVCRSEGAWPGGIHIEFTGEDVTECLGGSVAVLEEELTARYESLCDPRLNARQSLDLAFRVGELMRDDLLAGVAQGGGDAGDRAQERAGSAFVARAMRAQ
jgi:3-deoxy-7-phosphoheptulonate synthase